MAARSLGSRRWCRRRSASTHVLLWALSDPERLRAGIRTALRSRGNQLVVSVVTAWELSTKVRIGKPDAAPIVDAYAEALDRLGAVELPITQRHALLAGSLERDHRDPFDRMLASQSVIEDLILVSADVAFATAPGVRVRW